MRRHKSFIAFNRKPSPLVLEWIVKSLTIPPSQCGSNDSNLWPVSDTTCRTVCLTDPSNDQLVKDEGAQIFYSIQSQTKPIGIGANCEIPHKTHRHLPNIHGIRWTALNLLIHITQVCTFSQGMYHVCVSPSKSLA